MEAEVVALCFTPDEKIIIKAEEEGVIASWDLLKGEPVHKIVVFDLT